MITILDLIVTIFGRDLHGKLISMRVFTSIINKDTHMHNENYEERCYGLDLDSDLD
jgi:hypothetical protein